MIQLEEQIKWPEFVDPAKRIEIDLAGMRFGTRLSSNLKEFSRAEDMIQVGIDTERAYLYDSPETYGPKWYLDPGQSPWNYGARPHQTLTR